MPQSIAPTDWTAALLDEVRFHTLADKAWQARMHAERFHLVILAHQYLQAILRGTKTVECRFARVRQPPFGKVQSGDVLILKESGGAVHGLCTAGDVWSLTLAEHPLADIRTRFESRLGPVTDQFWKAQRQATYASMIELCNVRQVFPITCHKRDRRPWAIFTR
jgi:ASC-1-like (ASCH) protein